MIPPPKGKPSNPFGADPRKLAARKAAALAAMDQEVDRVHGEGDSALGYALGAVGGVIGGYFGGPAGAIAGYGAGSNLGQGISKVVTGREEEGGKQILGAAGTAASMAGDGSKKKDPATPETPPAQAGKPGTAPAPVVPPKPLVKK